MSKKKCDWCGKEYDSGSILGKLILSFFGSTYKWSYCCKQCQAQAKRNSR